MKTIISTMLLIVLLLGCSGKASTEKSLQLVLARGDIAAPIEITTNRLGANQVYDLRIPLVSAREATLIAFAKKHPDQDVQIMLNGRVLTDLRLPPCEFERDLNLGNQCDLRLTRRGAGNRRIPESAREVI